MYYAQNGEDKFLEKFLNLNPFDVSPRIIDIGALNGIRNSNSRMFIEHLGWSGVLIEPNPESYEQLEQNCSTLKNVYLENSAISGEDKIVDFLVCKKIPGHSRVPNSRHFVKPRFRNLATETVKVQSISVQTLFAKFPEFVDCGILDIDVEGLEETILIELMNSHIRPQIVMVEHQGHPDRISQQRDLLSVDYKLIATISVNDIWLLRSIANELGDIQIPSLQAYQGT